MKSKINFISFLSLIFLFFSSEVVAKNFTVSTVAELRIAIQEANNNAEDDIINLNPGIYLLDGAGGEDGSATGDLDLSSNIILIGSSARSTILRGGGNDRIVELIGAANLSINNLTIEGGRLSTGSGAGVYLSGGGNLIINGCEIRDNVTIGSTGPRVGGIHNSDGNVSINNSSIYNNHSPDGVGAGVTHVDGKLEVINTTVSGNTSKNTGGGIAISGGTALILNSTITGNSADSTSGEGIEVSGATLTMGNTIVAGNSSPPNESEDLRAGFTSLGGNIIGNNGEMKPIKFLTVIDQKPSDQIGFSDAPIDPMLGPLQDNGGPTDTHALLAGSPALNAGEDSQCFGEDQRGVGRPLQGQCDIGAFEVGCGDGTQESPQEECDDGNTADGDGCTSICKLETTGNGGGNGGAGASSGGCGQLAQGVVPGAYMIYVWMLFGLFGLVLFGRKKRSDLE